MLAKVQDTQGVYLSTALRGGRSLSGGAMTASISYGQGELESSEKGARLTYICTGPSRHFSHRLAQTEISERASLRHKGHKTAGIYDWMTTQDEEYDLNFWYAVRLDIVDLQQETLG